ncbi:MAG: hypothetical protein GY856_03990 [bacterium]|nr:hypothetical protein [bacterium]
MDWQEFVDRGFLGELARVFSNEAVAQALLEDIGFDRGRIPGWGGQSQNFWRAAAHEVEDGAVDGGLQRLIEAAAERYPYNRVFRGLSEPPGEPTEPATEPLVEEPEAPVELGPREDEGVSIFVTGAVDVHRLIDRAREIAAAHQIPGTVRLGIASTETIQLRLPEATPDQGLALTRDLEQEGLISDGALVPNDFRNYLLQVLFVEGPDQSRFELSDIPASTILKDIVRTVLNEYADEIWPRDRSGHSRPAIVDRINDDGSHTRLNPHETLHENEVRDGETLAVAPESTAGSVNPRTRDAALARVRSQVLAYAGAHPGFRVRANATIAPTEYVFNFPAPGWGPPAAPGGEPYPIDEHEVLLLMPADFPMVAPAAFWQTPVYHPNVAPEHDKKNPPGLVCLGELADRYRPGLDFGELCQILVDIARYWNYEIGEGYDEEARNWAVSPAGQIAIEQRGGLSVSRLLLAKLEEKVHKPLPLRVKRI